MKEQVLIHEIKSTKDSQANAKILLSKDEKRFYWDDRVLSKIETGDYVYVVNPTAGWAYYTVLSEKNILVGHDAHTHKSFFGDEGQRYEMEDPEGKFKTVVRFNILEKTSLPKGWRWTNPLRTSEQLFLHTKNIQEPEKRISRIHDLKKVFKTGKAFDKLEEAEVLLDPAKNNVQATSVPNEIIRHVYDYISALGFQYKEEEIANFYLSLKTKPFVILAGISGTGKTQLPRKFAAAAGMDKSQVIQLAVRPDWTDGSDLLGYTSLDGNFIPKDLTLAIKSAKENPGQPYFFILDEMNLARVEHYFSDFLSVIETREWEPDGKIKTDPVLRKESLQHAANAASFANFQWPSNLYLIGTVNMDETTHAFSRKVLDRANTIEMNDVDLRWSETAAPLPERMKSVSNSFFQTEYIHAIDLAEEEKMSVRGEMNILIAANKILEAAGLHFAYRVRDEVAFYLVLNKKYHLMDELVAMDFQFVQKVLPRIHGSSERVQVVLVELLNLLEGTGFRSVGFEYEQHKDKLTNMEFQYKRASSKIVFMLKRFEDDRFTSFWL